MTDNDIELIDNYIFNRLSDSARKEFEERLRSDVDFNEHFEFIKSLVNASEYSEELELREYLKGIKVEDKRKGIIFFLNQYKYPISIAAMFIIIFTIWQPQNLSNDKLFQNYLADANIKMPNNELNFERVETSERGEDLKLKNYTLEETQLFEEAIQLMDKNNFIDAKPILKSFNNIKPVVEYYLAISELKTGEINSAITRLELLNKSTNFFHDDIKYYLALGYLKTNKKKEVKELLNYLVEHQTKYKVQAGEILSSIRWF